MSSPHVRCQHRPLAFFCYIHNESRTCTGSSTYAVKNTVHDTFCNYGLPEPCTRQEGSVVDRDVCNTLSYWLASKLFSLTFSRLMTYIYRTAPLTSRCCILYIYSTNICTEYFKYATHSLFFSLFKMPFIS